MHNYERKTVQYLPQIEAAIHKHLKRPGGPMQVKREGE